MRAKRTSALGGLSPPLMSWSAEAGLGVFAGAARHRPERSFRQRVPPKRYFALRQGIVYCIGQAWTREHERWRGAPIQN